MKLISILRKYHIRQLFFPNIVSIFINPFYLIRRGMPNKIVEYALNFNGKMLDFGCGHKPYKSIFSHVDEYIDVDFKNEGHDHSKEDIDVYYDGNSLPFPDNDFDCAICTEVLEHVSDIDKTLILLHRVLKRNAPIILTVPFVWPEHEMPFDFRRFTMNGLVKMLEKHGFTVLKNHKNGNNISVIIQMQIMLIYHLLFVKNVYLNLFINFIFVFPITLIGILLSPIFFRCKSLYFNNIILAVKK
jgi:SAM-dependent methyltransferase